MNMSLLAAIILISLILCAIAIPFFIRSFLWQSILKKIYKGQYDEAIQQMNAPLYTLLFTSYEKITIFYVHICLNKIHMKLPNK
ncbi:hypothetical protein DWX92_06525 [Holdemanella biformis]|uniref:Uncharacterized protein n=1 Tax=Holdemanella biformis TaxID=1735 RepID=A0A412J148_9FIRM|nr:hypothetical protein DWX92_06525 [Holdemanella biformis]